MKAARRDLILAMLIFATIGVFRKYIPLPSGTLAMLRGFIGAFFLLGLMCVRRQKPDWAILRRRFLPLVVSGGLIGLNWILLFESYQYTSVAVATLCYYMAPVLVILLSPLVLREALPPRKLGCVAAALAGMVLVSGVLTQGVPAPAEMKGILLGLGAAALYAGVILMNKRLTDVPAYDRTVLQLAAAGAVLLPYVLLAPATVSGEITAATVLLVAVVGVLHTGVAYALYFGSMGRLPAQTVALYSYIDPVTAIVLSLLIFREPMGLAGTLGAVLILGAAFVSDRLD